MEKNKKENNKDLIIEEEINHIVDFIMKYQFLWKKEKLALIDKETIEDEIFKKIFKRNQKELKELRIIKNILELADDEILINTDNYILKDINPTRLKAEYSLNVFADYNCDFIEILTHYFNINDVKNKTNYGVNDKILNNYKKFLKGEINIIEIEEEDRKKILELLKIKNRKKIKSIINTVNISNFKNFMN